jgi:hypothetical protein
MLQKNKHKRVDNSVTVTAAARKAGVHVTNIYKSRKKLRAFKRAGQSQIPIDALEKYIQERQQRARKVLATTLETQGA